MHRKLVCSLFVLATVVAGPELRAAELSVDLRFAPPEWQATICLPDDYQKSLVDRSGELLYHYRQGGREFGTRVSLSVAPNAEWVSQQLYSPRVPIVVTTRRAPGLEIKEEAFAVTDLPQPSNSDIPCLARVDGQLVNRDWAKPPEGVSPSLANIVLHNSGSIHYRLRTRPLGKYCIALALCEGWWAENGQRVQILQVEGAEPVTVDTVADLGKNVAGAFWFNGKDSNDDGIIDIRINSSDQARDKNTILNGLWVFEAGYAIKTDALLAGKLNEDAVATMSDASIGGPPRNDLILAHITNTSDQTISIQPTVTVDTTLPVDYQRDNRQLVINELERVTTSQSILNMEAADKTRHILRQETVQIAPKQTVTLFVLYGTGSPSVIEPSTVEQAMVYRDKAISYWNQSPLPWGRVQVPDQHIQDLVDAAIRNIWQARERKNNLPAFQVGPTCYRGLWIVDGAFLLEAATMLGAGDEARNGVKYTLTFQQQDGRFEILPSFHKENGIVIWTCLRHAQLTQDKKWLESVWPHIEKAMGFITVLRKQSLENEKALDDGLMPEGIPDGGLGKRTYEYTNTYWNLVGVQAAIRAATWLGKADQASKWQKIYDDFYGTFRSTAKRDMLEDPHGNAYLPTYMGAEGKKLLPQRAQWSFCHAVYPGQLFSKTDPFVTDTLKMLQATEREGMVFGTGWDADGLWNYFASFYGHAWLWQGNGKKAAESLYAFANHAAPILAWREEQSPKGDRYKKVGDMPHNWASAEFIRLTIHLLALDRGNELHLFEGLPVEWTKPGMLTRLNRIATPFGPLSVSLKVSADGKTADLKVASLPDPSCEKIVVHLGGWTDPNGNITITLDPRRDHSREISLTGARN